MKECTMCALKEAKFNTCIFVDCPNKKKHGGKRKGAGRKRIYTEETQTISFRVPVSLIEPINKYVKRALAKSKK